MGTSFALATSRSYLLGRGELPDCCDAADIFLVGGHDHTSRAVDFQLY